MSAAAAAPARRRPRRRLNLAKLNHVLIPSTKAERDRFRRGLAGRLTDPVWHLYHAFTREGRLALGLWLLVGLASLDVRTTQGYVVWAALTGILFGALAIRRAFALRAVTVEAEAPRRVAVGEEVRLGLRLRNHGERDHEAIRIRGPMLPWDGRYTGPPPRLALLPAGETRTLLVGARFTARGEHHLDTFMAVAVAPFGLTAGPGVTSGGTRLLVVPRIAVVTRLTTPTTARYQPGGVALASRVGESAELLGVRPYRAGDPIRDLHARTWARVGSPVVREYQQEYFTRFGVVVDTDGVAGSETRLEAALSLAAGVVAHLSRGEALVDLLVVGEEVHDLTLGRSLGFLDQALDLLACVEAGPALDGGALAARLAPHLGRLSCVVVVAQAWDEARERLADEVLARGVGLRVLLVDEEGDGAASGPSRLERTAVPAGAILAGEELSL